MRRTERSAFKLSRESTRGHFKIFSSSSVSAPPLAGAVDGKERPICLLATLIRIWEYIRAPYMLDWLRDNDREWAWGSSGKSAEMAAWHTLLVQEAAQHRREEAAREVVAENLRLLERSLPRGGLSSGGKTAVERAIATCTVNSTNYQYNG